MEDYLDHAKEMSEVQALQRRADLAIFTTKARSADEVVERLAGADIAITIRDRVMFDEEVLSRVGAKSLKLLSVCGPRLDPHVDLAAATRAGILVCCAPANTVPKEPHHATSEVTWALILGLFKSVIENQAHMRAGGWQTRISQGVVGKTLGVVGPSGKVGKIVVTVGKAMGMRVVGWSPQYTPDRAAEQGIECVSFDTLLRESDIVTLHANATPQSAGLFGAKEFAAMRRHAVLINTARAALVQETALKDALDSGTIAAAGLDVYWNEPPPPDHWVRSHPRVLMQPHMGGFTKEGYEWIVAPGVQMALDWLDGKPVNIRNPEAARAAAVPIPARWSKP
ncbi:NAD(P)-dependent oxidoreductase [Ramlibacter sp.]|uniref:NAD(P)-dependent oxidoreductase n=1 Tax=Ramlibacter sp. TaxID=1917967 RepID=UPI003D117FA1